MGEQPHEYEVLKDGEIMHQPVKAGDRIKLMPAQAKYYLPPHDARLKPVGGGKGKSRQGQAS